MLADLHTHTNNSDGLYSTKEVLELAYQKGLDIVAITDHDCIDGNEIAIDYDKVFALCGVELSTRHNGESIHILGYFKNRDYNQKELKDFLDNQKRVREERAKKIISLLKENFNIEITYENLLRNADGVIARPHIAKTIIEAGYHYTKDEIFAKMIGEGCLAYVPSTIMETKDGIELLKRNNCLVVLAHPVLIKKTNVQYFIDLGIDGIEAIYPKNTKDDTIYFQELARINNLLITAGSDFHGFMDDSHHDLATCTLKDENIKKLLERLGINYEKNN